MNQKSNKAVVTAITKDYDTLRQPLVYNPDWDYIAYIEGDNIKPIAPWKCIKISSEQAKHIDRMIKIQPHKFLQHETIVWIDGGGLLICDPEELVSAMGERHFLCFKHPKRLNIWQDLNRIMERGLVDPRQLLSVYKNIVKHSTSVSNTDYFEMGIYAAKMTQETKSLLDSWWHNFTLLDLGRDQPAFALAHNPVVMRVMDWKFKSQFAVFGSHRSGKNYPIKQMTEKVNYIVNLHSSSDISFINTQISRIPDDEWVCLVDADTMFLGSSAGKHIETVVKNFPHIHLFGSMVNRQGLMYQVYCNGAFEETNILYHLRTSEYLGTQVDVRLINQPIAGQMMLFPAWVGKDIRFDSNVITESGVYFDWKFCQDLLAKGGNIGLIKSLYRFHLYRMGKTISTDLHLR